MWPGRSSAVRGLTGCRRTRRAVRVGIEAAARRGSGSVAMLPHRGPGNVAPQVAAFFQPLRQIGPGRRLIPCRFFHARSRSRPTSPAGCFSRASGSIQAGRAGRCEGTPAKGGSWRARPIADFPRSGLEVDAGLVCNRGLFAAADCSYGRRIRAGMRGRADSAAAPSKRVLEHGVASRVSTSGP